MHKIHKKGTYWGGLAPTEVPFSVFLWYINSMYHLLNEVQMFLTSSVAILVCRVAEKLWLKDLLAKLSGKINSTVGKP